MRSFEPAGSARVGRSRAIRAAAAMLLLASAGCEPLLLTPSQYGELRVTVTTAAGEPVPDVSLVLYTGVRPMYYASTDAAGGYSFEQVPPGNYGVAATMPPGMCDVTGATALVKDNLDMAPGSERLLAFTIQPCVRASIAPAPAR